MNGIAELRKRAMLDPQSLSEVQWKEIHKVAFSAPKKESNDEGNAAARGPSKKRKGWW